MRVAPKANRASHLPLYTRLKAHKPTTRILIVKSDIYTRSLINRLIRRISALYGLLLFYLPLSPWPTCLVRPNGATDSFYECLLFITWKGEKHGAIDSDITFKVYVYKTC